MELVHLKNPSQPFPAMDCALCLGHFDGVHLGHRALIQRLNRLCKQDGRPLPQGALLFKAPPALYLSKTPTPQLTPLEEKLRLLKQTGLQFAILLDFEEVRNLSPDDFVRDILIRDCRCRLAVCGFNYSYGQGGKGTPQRLAETFGTQPGRTLEVVEPVLSRNMPISSTEIRRLLENGHPEDATRLLGHPFSLSGKVQGGRQVGTEMGFPTANLTFPPHMLIPARGVYLVTVRVGRRSFFGLSNVGTRPTFDDGDAVTCETFLMDFNGDLYGKEITVSFLRFLRAERKFESKVALEAQIRKDLERAKEYM